MHAASFIAILVAAQAALQSDGTQSATDIANATKYVLTFDHEQVTGCTITATSGSPKVDRYICDAARDCGNQHSDADHQAACVTRKCAQLATELAKALAERK